MQDKNSLLEIENVKKYFPVREGVFKKVTGHVKAVDNVSLDVIEGETLGLVGESGCGKSTLGMTILRLLKPTKGRIFIEGEDTTPWFMGRFEAWSYIKENYIKRFDQLKDELGTEDQVIDNLEHQYDKDTAKLYFEQGKGVLERKFLSNLGKRKKDFRREAQIIFQDPYSSLNPRMRVRGIVAEGLLTHGIIKSNEVNDKVVEVLEKVCLSGEYLYRYPHQFSGGQRQRIGLARALALRPKLVIADEAVSALDVSVQSQILNLMKDLQKEFNLTYVFISHDLSVIEHISTRIAVMYLGKVAEVTKTENLFQKPMHPYTIALMSAIPIPDPEKKKKRIVLEGDVPSPLKPPSGCPFHPRCPIADKSICAVKVPDLIEKEPGHFVACHKAGEFNG